jgi:hypothetical protein
MCQQPQNLQLHAQSVKQGKAHIMAHGMKKRDRDLVLSQVPVELVDLVESADIQKFVHERHRKEMPAHIQEGTSPVESGRIHNLHSSQ